MKSGNRKKYDVVALGELLVDMAEGTPSEQGNMTFEACPGGAPCNVLSLLSKAGMSTAFIGKVGDDFLGHMLSSVIEEIGIDTSGLLFDSGVNTTLAFVHKKQNGDRDFSFYRNPGADMMLNESEINYEMIRNSRIFHFGSLSMTSDEVCRATEKAVLFARENNVTVSFDPNLREPLWDSLLLAKEKILWGMAHCDILKISDNEVEFVTGCSDMNEGFKKVTEMTSARIIFVTLGADGSMGWAGDKIIRMPGKKMEKIVDTTGAGDTFMGTALLYLLKKNAEYFERNITDSEGFNKGESDKEESDKRESDKRESDKDESDKDESDNENCLLKLRLPDARLSELLRLANDTAAQITRKKGALKVMPEVNI